MVSYALYVGIGLSAMYIAVSSATPYIEDMRDTAAIQRQMDTLTELDQLVRQMSQMAEGAQSTQTVQVDRGEMFLENQTIVYELTTRSDIISSGSSREIGEILLSANAQSTLVETTHDGTPCYRMENQYVEACIKKIGGEDSFDSASLDELLLYMYHKPQQEMVEPTLDVVLDEDDMTAEGQIRTEPVAVGDHLGTAEVVVFVKPSDRPTYELDIRLHSGADYLHTSVN
jgi:hypothetical protein